MHTSVANLSHKSPSLSSSKTFSQHLFAHIFEKGASIPSTHPHNTSFNYNTASVALTLALSLLTTLQPTFFTPPALAEIVRVEDVQDNLLRTGLEAANVGRLAEATRFFQLYVNKNPSSASGWSNLATTHLQQNNPQLAEEEYTKAVNLAPTAPVPKLNRATAREALGVLKYEKGDISGAETLWKAALEDCDQAVALDPNEFAAWYNRANIRMQLEDWPAALDDATRAADLAPGLAGYRLRQGTLLFQIPERQVDAERVIRGVIRKNPQYAEAFAALAAIQWSKGDQGASAEDLFSRAVQIEERWSDLSWVERNTRWPPLLMHAFKKFGTVENM
jgi:tetratricopeptide (TPR) repeat protein